MSKREQDSDAPFSPLPNGFDSKINYPQKFVQAPESMVCPKSKDMRQRKYDCP